MSAHKAHTEDRVLLSPVPQKLLPLLLDCNHFWKELFFQRCYGKAVRGSLSVKWIKDPTYSPQMLEKTQ